MKVLLVTQYGPQSASSRTRVYQYLPHLEAVGIEADIRPIIPDAAVQRSGRRGRMGNALYYFSSLVRTAAASLACALSAGRYDAVLVQKAIFPSSAAWLLKRHRKRVVFDFDDAIFTTESEGRGFFAKLRASRRGRGLPRMLKAAAQAIVENDYTAEFAQRYGARVARITGPIDTDRYAPLPSLSEGGVTLGWIGSPTTTPYLDLIRGPIEDIAASFPDIQVRLIGASPYSFPSLAPDSRPWNFDSEVGNLATFDIGLMPLPDDPWTVGKGGYKILQYSAMGLPVVASPVGVNCELVEHGVTGFLAGSDAEWVEALTMLIEDPSLRQTMGAAGRAKMVSGYSLAKASLTFEHVLRSASAQ